MPDAPLPDCLLEQITAQQAHVAVLDKRLQAAERAVGSAITAAAGAAAHRRADDALTALEAAEGTLRELFIRHAAATTPATVGRRRRRAAVTGQDALFEVGWTPSTSDHPGRPEWRPSHPSNARPTTGMLLLVPAIGDQTTPRWPGPSKYTLLAWMEIELLLESGAQVHAAHAVITEAADRAFGAGWIEQLVAAADAEGCPTKDGHPSLAAMRGDEIQVQRVLDRLHDWMRARAGQPGAAPAPSDLTWRTDPGTAH